MSADDVRQKLRDGHPSIETVGNDEEVRITTWMMEPGQERIVAQRVREVLASA
jgi:L-seryl-tRNA(Ser) seleniumtransferase